ncbi:hypothetical protein BKM31_14195 [[Actinomadura] parvosata subsp. kistnae]|uniref:Tn3 transposase DDE domain-containing protein n=1 Tax=[Actinomadura] parvosata subsp. kistnae TaxID=1909395 RepID=A0A1U9ZWY8_9ACTN|nr:transposase [Nonomuraea sp. ATCC 55076]AQZ62457.1 hypothetical protein BKM31_14195 [Nonomuraea sp. ATCC 55076]
MQGQNSPVFALATLFGFDLMRVAISISEGRLSSATLMRRLRSDSRKNRISETFREAGRSSSAEGVGCIEEVA